MYINLAWQLTEIYKKIDNDLVNSYENIITLPSD